MADKGWRTVWKWQALELKEGISVKLPLCVSHRAGVGDTERTRCNSYLQGTCLLREADRTTLCRMSIGALRWTYNLVRDDGIQSVMVQKEEWLPNLAKKNVGTLSRFATQINIIVGVFLPTYVYNYVGYTTYIKNYSLFIRNSNWIWYLVV